MHNLLTLTWSKVFARHAAVIGIQGAHSMMTKEQADITGDALVCQVRKAEVERKNLAARPVPLMYRFPELKRFEVWERPLVLAEAGKAAIRKRSFIAAWLLSVMLAIGISYALIAQHQATPMLLSWIGFPAVFVPLLVRREHMRKYIRRKSASLVL